MEAKRNRRWFAFSLRTLFELVLVCAVLFSAFRQYPSSYIRQGDYLDVQVTGTLLGAPINGVHRVDSAGELNLGPTYKNVLVAGMTTAQATAAVTASLKKMLRTPEVAISEVPEPYAEAAEYEATIRNLRAKIDMLERNLKNNQAQLNRLQSTSPPAE